MLELKEWDAISSADSSKRSMRAGGAPQACEDSTRRPRAAHRGAISPVRVNVANRRRALSPVPACEKEKTSHAADESLHGVGVAQIAGRDARERRMHQQMCRLGRLIEGAAIGQGVLQLQDSKLSSAKLAPDQIADLGVLSDEKCRRVRWWLARADETIIRDSRICCLCRIMGDCAVQGRYFPSGA